MLAAVLDTAASRHGKSMSIRHGWIAPRALIVAALLLAGMPAQAAEPDLAPAPSSTILYKTVTYQALSALNNFAFGVYVLGGAALGGSLAVTSIVTEPVSYFAHEWVWSGVASRLAAPPAELIPVKTATYTVLTAGRTYVIGLVLTGSPAVAAGFMVFNSVADAASYLLNDLAWLYLAPPPERGLAPDAAVAQSD